MLGVCVNRQLICPFNHYKTYGSPLKKNCNCDRDNPNTELF
ncbi:hypothetical protein AVDCRST_MAG84-1419 [uncultured Microcoleus sp.]|uniref:Uncharacterized protein n=1 Tax=uncultured Microcoleus sp. TaxID=259945 RepID=A0A6J4L3T1_9CYAN|nr:hypothetical protein AVDCRST_MAG84-1419 [uncultured Microcoleus sp.]